MGLVFKSGISDATHARLRREDCEFVKHDKLFSKWKILVGPSDSREVASAGTNGAAAGKYHVQNLPAVEVGPGVFELGVTAPAWTSPAPRSSPLKKEDVIPVYVGQATNIRHRLQKFGQAGTPLESSSRSAQLYQGDEESDYISSSPRWRLQSGSEAKSPAGTGPRLFSEVFALGSSIAFRWAHTDSKVVAEQVEAELLVVFDYAWNKGVDGHRRSRDILVKLFMAWPSKETTASSAWNPISSCNRSPGWLSCGRKAVGIKVALRKPGPSTSTKSMMGNLCSLMTVQPLVADPGQLQCGVITTKGRPCNAPAMRGRKHCVHHNGTKRVTAGKQFNTVDRVRRDPTVVKGVNFGAGLTRWRFGFLLGGRHPCFTTRTRRVRESNKRSAAGSVSTEEQPSAERRRPYSLSFNTWVTDDQRVHNNGDAEPTTQQGGVSLQHKVDKLGAQQPASGFGGSQAMDCKRRALIRRSSAVSASMPVDDSHRR